MSDSKISEFDPLSKSEEPGAEDEHDWEIVSSDVPAAEASPAGQELKVDGSPVIVPEASPSVQPPHVDLDALAASPSAPAAPLSKSNADLLHDFDPLSKPEPSAPPAASPAADVTPAPVQSPAAQSSAASSSSSPGSISSSSSSSAGSDKKASAPPAEPDALALLGLGDKAGSPPVQRAPSLDALDMVLGNEQQKGAADAKPNKPSEGKRGNALPVERKADFDEPCFVCRKPLPSSEAEREKHVTECLAKAEKQAQEDEKLARELAGGEPKKPAPKPGDKCPLCSKEFFSQKQFIEHVQSCGVPKPKPRDDPNQQCAVCGKSGFRAAELKAHVARCRAGLPDLTQCPLCQDEFLSTEIEKHVTTCTGKKSKPVQVNCPICFKPFAKDVIDRHVSRCVGN